MASKKTLNAANLEELGAERLAELLIEISTGDAQAKRRLRLALVEEQSPEALGLEVRKRLTSIGRSRSFISWRKRKAALEDLQTQRKAVIGPVLEHDPGTAFELLLRLMALGDGLLDRCRDSSGEFGQFFRSLQPDLLVVASKAGVGPGDLAEKIFELLDHNGFGLYDTIIVDSAPCLGDQGLDHLEGLVRGLLEEEEPGEPDYLRRGLWQSAQRTLLHYLEQIADARGDVDAFIAQQTGATRRLPSTAFRIAERLFAAGRHGEALSALEDARFRSPSDRPSEFDWLEIAILEALGRIDDAQAMRFACFERDLDPDMLRDYLKKLPDFDDIKAERRAILMAENHDDHHAALQFLVLWEAHDAAARLALKEEAEFDGNLYELLGIAADALSPTHPLAATALLRRIIIHTLSKRRTRRYRFAVKHMVSLDQMAALIERFDPLPSHDAFVAGLRQAHPRLHRFWSTYRDAAR